MMISWLWLKMSTFNSITTQLVIVAAWAPLQYQGSVQSQNHCVGIRPELPRHFAEVWAWFSNMKGEVPRDVMASSQKISQNVHQNSNRLMRFPCLVISPRAYHFQARPATCQDHGTVVTQHVSHEGTTICSNLVVPWRARMHK